MEQRYHVVWRDSTLADDISSEDWYETSPNLLAHLAGLYPERVEIAVKELNGEYVAFEGKHWFSAETDAQAIEYAKAYIKKQDEKRYVDEWSLVDLFGKTIYTHEEEEDGPIEEEHE